jgi:hypothetical protein
MKNYSSNALHKIGSFVSFLAVALALTVLPALAAQHMQASSSQDSYSSVNTDTSDSVYACWR